MGRAPAPLPSGMWRLYQLDFPYSLFFVTADLFGLERRESKSMQTTFFLNLHSKFSVAHPGTLYNEHTRAI